MSKIAMQLELSFEVEARERERLLQEVDFGKIKNRTLVAAILREIASYPAGRCYVSQETLARRFKVCVKSIQRALKVLEDLNLIAKMRIPQRVAGDLKRLNTYSVIWQELKSRVAKNQGDTCDAQHDSCDAQHDSYGLATRQLSDGNTTASSPVTKQNSTEETNNSSSDGAARSSPDAASVVVVSSVNEDPETRATAQRLVDQVVACGIGRAEEAVRRALDRGLTEPDVLERVAFWQSSPEAERRPGVLYNWLAFRGSYESTVRERSVSRPHSSARAAEAIERYRREREAADSGGITEEEKQLMRAAGLKVH